MKTIFRLDWFRHKKRYEKINQDLKEKESKGIDVDDLKKALKQLEAEGEEIRKQEEDLKRKEKVSIVYSNSILVIFHIYLHSKFPRLPLGM